MNEILKKLSTGDLRSEGESEEVALEIVNNPSLLLDLIQGMQSENKVVRARVCMTMEIISRQHPEILNSVTSQLIELAARDTVAQVRWHIAEIFGNVHVREEDIERVVQILFEYLEDKSKIVKYCSVQTLGILGRRSASRDEIVDKIQDLKGVSKSMQKIVTKTLQNLGYE